MRCVGSRDLRLWSFDNQELEGQGVVTGDTHQIKGTDRHTSYTVCFLKNPRSGRSRFSSRTTILTDQLGS